MPNQYTSPIPLADRLWPRLLHEDVERVPGLGPCWIWPGAKNRRTGYGYIVVKRQGKRWHVDTHRIAYTLINGPLPSKIFTCHHCDVPLCCRPDHLFAGTHADNLRDMAAKGRSALGDRNGSRTHPERVPRGETCWQAKLTTESVRTMRARYSQGNVTHQQLADESGVERGVISRMLRGETWKHV